MSDVKRLFVILTAVTFLVGNMAAFTSYANETEEIYFDEQESISEDLENTIYEDMVDEFQDDNAETENETQQSEEIADDASNNEYESNIQEEILPENNINISPENNISENAFAVTNGQGDIEGLVNTNVFQVSLPVNSSNIDYIADPQKLIYKTGSARHPESVYDPDANVFFNNGKITAEDGTEKNYYTNISSPLVIVNKSSCPVSVTARVRVFYEQGAENPVIISPDREWEGVKKPSICLSVVNNADMSETVLSQSEKVITSSIAGCPNAYKFVYEENLIGEKEYGYRLMTDEELSVFKNENADVEFKTFSLSIKGECNSDGEWDHKINYDFPSTSIIWNVGTALSAKPCINTVKYSVAYGSAINIPYSLGLFNSAASKIISAEYISPDGETISVLDDERYFGCTDNMINVTAELSSYAHSKDGGILKIGFNDPDSTITDIILDNNASPSLDEKEYTVLSGDSRIVITYDLGVGNKAASGIKAVSFGNNDFSSSAYSTVEDGKIILNTSAVRTIKMKNGGNVYITFDDAESTKCGIKILIE